MILHRKLRLRHKLHASPRPDSSTCNPFLLFIHSHFWSGTKINLKFLEKNYAQSSVGLFKQQDSIVIHALWRRAWRNAMRHGSKSLPLITKSKRKRRGVFCQKWLGERDVAASYAPHGRCCCAPSRASSVRCPLLYDKSFLPLDTKKRLRRVP